MPPSNIVSVIYHTSAVCRGGAFMSLMFYATFDNVSVIYHISAVGRVLRRLMFYATFNIQSFTTPLL
jgi:hypothetical protein